MKLISGIFVACLVQNGLLLNVKMNCTRVKDGQYPDPVEPCSKKFFVCAGGAVFEFKCPPRTRYDEEINDCQYPGLVRKCGGKPPPKKTTTTTEPTTTTGAPTTTVIERLKGVNCTDMANKDYALPGNPCSVHFYACVHDRLIEKICPLHLRYDVTTNSCLQLENVVACNGTATTMDPDVTKWSYYQTTTHGGTTAGEVTDSTEYVHSTTELTAATGDSLKKKQFDCEGKATGSYHADPEKGCSPRFYRCLGEAFAEAFVCSKGTYFDPTLNVCNFFFYIPACETTASSTSTTSTTTTSTVTMTTIILSTVPSKEFHCRGKITGNHPNPHQRCSNAFYSCSDAGSAFKWNCPGRTYFDVQLNQCLYWIEVPECSGFTRPLMKTTTTISTSTTTSSSSTGTTAQLSTSTVEKSTTEEVQTFKWNCLGERTSTFKLNQCLYWTKVLECSGFTRPPMNTTITIIRYGSSTGTTAQISASTVENSTTQEGFDCTLKRPRNYPDPAAGCSRHFYICTNAGNAFKTVCPGTMYYDRTDDQCKGWTEVAACDT